VEYLLTSSKAHRFALTVNQKDYFLS